MNLERHGVGGSPGLSSGLPAEYKSEARSASLSERLWSLCWADRLPVLLDTEITLRSASFSEIESFVAAHFGRIYGEPTSPDWLASAAHPARQSFYREVADCFVFERRAEIVGILICHATDWSSYYLRNISILPEYQNRKLYQLALEVLLAALTQSGVERMEVEVAAVNQRAIRALSKKGFICTGHSISERWGHLSRYTCFLNSQCASVFSRRFFVQTLFGKEEP